jgi:hypothetical protein
MWARFLPVIIGLVIAFIEMQTKKRGASASRMAKVRAAKKAKSLARKKNV